MQWSDRETIEIIKYLLRSLKDTKITFLFIYRQEEKGVVLEDFSSSISRETRVKKVGVVPFEHNTIKKMVKLIIGEDPSKELLDYITQGSGGNPFYIEEILKELNEAGHLRAGGDTWKFENPGAEIIPKSIEDITERKYQVLSKEGKKIIEIATVIGWFDIGMIQAITGYNEGHIIGVLEKIKHVGLIRERGDRIVFQEKISRDAIYKRYVSAIKARMLHKQVGEQITAQYKGQEEEVVESLAFHFYHGADQERGVRYCLEAGDRTREKYANASALQYYNWAEELLRGATDKKSIGVRIDCLLKHTDVLRFIGNNEAALRILEDGLKEAQRINDKKKVVDIIFRKASVHVNISHYSEAFDEANECIKIYEELGDKESTAQVLNVIGNAQGFLGKYKKALKLYGNALKISRHIGDKNFEARLLNNMGLTYLNLDDHKKALNYFEDSLKIKGAKGDKYRGGAVLNNIGLIHMDLGEYKKALKNYKEALKIFQEIGNKYGEALVLNNIGIIYENMGDYRKGLQFSEEAMSIARNTENKYCEVLALNNIGGLYLLWGTYEKALQYFEKALKVAEKMKSNEQSLNNLIAIGNAYLVMNESDKAKKIIDKAYKIAEHLHSKRKLRDVLFLLFDFYLEQKNLTKCKTAIKTLEAAPETMTSKKTKGRFDILMGRYYSELKNFKKAATHFNKALKLFETMGESLNKGIAYYYMGMSSLRKGDVSIYKKQLKKSLKIFTSLGAKGWRDKAQKVLGKSS